MPAVSVGSMEESGYDAQSVNDQGREIEYETWECVAQLRLHRVHWGVNGGDCEVEDGNGKG